MLIFLGRAFMNIMDGAGRGDRLLLGRGLMVGPSNTNLWALALTILITTLSTCGLGLMLGSLALVTVNVMFINNLVYFLLLIFSGANVVLEELPGWVQSISSALPLTRGIAAARLLVGGASLSEAAPLLWGELGIGVLYSLLGYALFTIFELEAKRRGTLELA
jgi:ABC-2 type transport system permease protein